MLISRIVKGVNDMLAGELLTYTELRPFLDSTIDDINNELDTTFPVFSELSGLREVIEALVSDGHEFLKEFKPNDIVKNTNTYYISGNENGFKNAFIDTVRKHIYWGMWNRERREWILDKLRDTDYLLSVAEEIWEHTRITPVEYDYFPDRYLREVVTKGAAYKFYIMDEEGLQTAQQFKYDYQDALFRMVRDYLAVVPPEFRALNTASVRTHYDDYMPDTNFWRHSIW